MTNPTVLTMNVGDTSPAFTGQLKNRVGYQNLGDANTVTLILEDTETEVETEFVCTVIDAPTGTYKYQWIAGDLDTPGRYLIKTRVVFTDGSIQTWPNKAIYYLVVK